MSLQGMRVFNAAVQQYQLHQENTEKIKAMKQKTVHDAETHELEKKKALLDIEHKKHIGVIDDMKAEISVQQVGEFFKQQKQITDGATAAQKIAEAEQRKGMMSQQNIMQKSAQHDPDVQKSLLAIKIAQDSINQGILVPDMSSPSGIVMKRENTRYDKYKDTEKYQVDQMTQKMIADDELADNPETDGMSYSQKAKYFKGKAEEIVYGKIEPTNSTSTKKIKMRAPNGTIGYIPSNKASEAEERGFTRVQ